MVNAPVFRCQCWLLAALLALPVLAEAKPEHVLKFATLAPSGSTWMLILEDWAEKVERESQGRLGFKFYPGGVQGDEPDVLKKMRFGQIHGAAFSGHGIGSIYSPARVLELPFMFDTFAEIDYVRDRLTPEFQEGFREHGYELLGWMELGFVHMFSQEPIKSIEQLKEHRVWLWQGDPMGHAFFHASGISPVPLSIIDVFTSLSTGLVDTVYCTPLASIALQWFTKTRYVTETALTNAMGAMVVSRRFFDRLPADLQQLLRQTGRETGQRLIAATREDNARSIEELKARGMIFTDASHLPEAELRAITERAARELMNSGYLPEATVQRARALVEEFRSAAEASHPPADG